MWQSRSPEDPIEEAALHEGAMWQSRSPEDPIEEAALHEGAMWQARSPEDPIEEAALVREPCGSQEALRICSYGSEIWSEASNQGIFLSMTATCAHFSNAPCIIRST